MLQKFSKWAQVPWTYFSDLVDEKEKNRRLELKSAKHCGCNNLEHCELCGELYSDTHWFEPSIDEMPPGYINSFQYFDSTTPYGKWNSYLVEQTLH